MQAAEFDLLGPGLIFPFAPSGQLPGIDILSAHFEANQQYYK